jgi:3-mercaptopyruvate sulfurtransferase SseA
MTFPNFRLQRTSRFSSAFRQAGMLLLAALVPALLAAVLHPRRPAWSRGLSKAPEVSWSAVQKWRGLVLLVDARPAAEFINGHIPGAFSLNEQEWERRLPDLIRAWQPGARVVVYGADEKDARSQAIARWLKHDLGVDGIYVLEGGWDVWLEAHPPQR